MHLPLTPSQETALGLLYSRGVVRNGDNPAVTLNTAKALRDLGLVVVRGTAAEWWAVLAEAVVVEVVAPPKPRRRRRRG